MSVGLAVKLLKHLNIVGMTDGGCDISKVGPITVEEVNNPDFFCFLAEFALCFLTALNVGAKKGICTLAFKLPAVCHTIKILIIT